MFQPLLGHDLSSIRVHHDDLAVTSARQLEARAYTTNGHVVFGAGGFSHESSDGRRLIAHELTHAVQQSAGAHLKNVTGETIAAEAQADSVANAISRPIVHRERVVLPQPVPHAPIIQRKPDDSTGTDLSASSANTDVKSASNPVLAVFDVRKRAGWKPWSPDRLMLQISRAFAQSKGVRVKVYGFYGDAESVSELDDAVEHARLVAEALHQMGVPRNRILESVWRRGTPSLIPGFQQAAISGRDAAVVLEDLRGGIAPFVDLKELVGPSEGVFPDFVVHKGEPASETNPRIVQAVKQGFASALVSPGGKIRVVTFAASGELKDSTTARSDAEARALAVRMAFVTLGLNAIDIIAEPKLLPANDPRVGETYVTFEPAVAPLVAEAPAIDFSKYLTFAIETPRGSFSIKIPKSIEGKLSIPSFGRLEGKLTPQGISATYRQIGDTGVEISLSGDVSKLGDLFKSAPEPAPPPPARSVLPAGGAGRYTRPPATSVPATGLDPNTPPTPPTAPGPTLKGTLTFAYNGKGFRVESTSVLDTGDRTFSSGLSVSFMERVVKYQVPSTVYGDLNKAGADLQKAANKLMYVHNQDAGARAVGDPAPKPEEKVKPELSDLGDALSALGDIASAMDTIDKAKDTAVRATFKIGPTVKIPWGDPSAPLASPRQTNAPSFGIEFSVSFK
jgi:hypothetical protein